jgi:hypothetical protein
MYKVFIYSNRKVLFDNENIISIVVLKRPLRDKKNQLFTTTIDVRFIISIRYSNI